MMCNYFFSQISDKRIKSKSEDVEVFSGRACSINLLYGCTTNACVPLAVYSVLSNHLLNKGAKIILTGVGGGNCYTAIAAEWAF